MPLLASLRTGLAVSYTHLDVYKRQLLPRHAEGEFKGMLLSELYMLPVNWDFMRKRIFLRCK